MKKVPFVCHGILNSPELDCADLCSLQHSFVRYCVSAKISRGATDFLLIQCSIPRCWVLESSLNVFLGEKEIIICRWHMLSCWDIREDKFPP